MNVNLFKRTSLVLFSLSIAVSPVFAGVTIASPENKTEVTTPFNLYAEASTCSLESVTEMGFSLDSDPDTVAISSNSIRAQVTASPGVHTLHVKAWGDKGTPCVTDVTVTVDSAPVAGPARGVSFMSEAVHSAISESLGPVSVSSPTNGESVTSPFALAASAASCSSEGVVSMGYSLDSGLNVAIVDTTSIHASVTAANGKHVLHVKSWGKSTACDTDIAITVTGQAGGGGGSSGNGVTVSKPVRGATVTSPFALSANAATCLSQPVGTMGYSLDGSSDTTVVSGKAINLEVPAASGGHTLHVKAWGTTGASCVEDVPITVNGGTPPSGGGGGSGGPYIPPYATSVSSIQTFGDWKAAHDTGGPGSSTGYMAIVGSPSRSGHARRMITKYSKGGDERYSVTFGDDISATNFVYDGWVYIAQPSYEIANLELDLNQVMANGQTVIYGFQCDGYDNRWDFAENRGTPKKWVAHWIATGAPCNVRNWSTYTWHHVQISYSRNNYGVVTYKGVWFDGHEYGLNATVPSAFALGWGPQMSLNFQVDGLGGGGQTVLYVDDLTLYRW